MTATRAKLAQVIRRDYEQAEQLWTDGVPPWKWTQRQRHAVAAYVERRLGEDPATWGPREQWGLAQTIALLEREY